jgi:hypothetical protein
MVDFKKLLGDHKRPPKPPQIVLKAERTNPNTETTTEVEVAIWINTLDNGQRWAQLDGGPTGYESFQLDDHNIRRGWGRGWNACMGSRSAGACHAGYDRLVIPWRELQRFFEWAGIEEPEEAP